MKISQEKAAQLIEQGILTGEEAEQILSLQRQQEEQKTDTQKHSVDYSLTPQYGKLNPATGRAWTDSQVEHQERIQKSLDASDVADKQVEKSETFHTQQRKEPEKQQQKEPELSPFEKVMSQMKEAEESMKKQLSDPNVAEAEKSMLRWQLQEHQKATVQFGQDSVKNGFIHQKAEQPAKPAPKPFSQMSYEEKVQATLDAMD